MAQVKTNNTTENPKRIGGKRRTGEHVNLKLFFNEFFSLFQRVICEKHKHINISNFNSKRKFETNCMTITITYIRYVHYDIISIIIILIGHL